MRLLQRSERESKRQGAFGTGTNRNLLDRDERKEFQARLGLAQKLLPAAGGDDAARQRRNEAEGLVEKAAASGWSQLSPAEQAGFEELWRTALPSLPAQEVRRGREEGVFPPRDQERVFGANLPLALTGRPLEGPLGWLSPPQLERARGLASETLPEICPRCTRGCREILRADWRARRYPRDAREHAGPLSGSFLSLAPSSLWLLPLSGSFLSLAPSSLWLLPLSGLFPPRPVESRGPFATSRRGGVAAPRRRRSSSAAPSSSTASSAASPRGRGCSPPRTRATRGTLPRSAAVAPSSSCARRGSTSGRSRRRVCASRPPPSAARWAPPRWPTRARAPPRPSWARATSACSRRTSRRGATRWRPAGSGSASSRTTRRTLAGARPSSSLRCCRSWPPRPPRRSAIGRCSLSPSPREPMATRSTARAGAASRRRRRRSRGCTRRRCSARCSTRTTREGWGECRSRGGSRRCWRSAACSDASSRLQSRSSPRARCPRCGRRREHRARVREVQVQAVFCTARPTHMHIARRRVVEQSSVREPAPLLSSLFLL
ncbi:hypothetical protein EMIHUDRAFT_440493, partial [Emiliania huxleyi CCMP1516]|uniref:Uncharacterized protein n=2 Tax=Emiliania huxleyi TaxID=2903 RepID=A0A0D3KMT7_EMIH1